MRPAIFSIITAIGIAVLPTATWAGLPESAIPGGVVTVPVSQTATVTFDGKPVLKAQSADDWYAVVGVPLNAAKQIVVSVDGEELHIPISDFAYEEQHIEIKETRKVNPQKNDMDRIGMEYGKMTPVYKSHSEALTPDWADMIRPAQGPYSSAFGLKRFFNGQARKPHSGIDIAAPEGAPIIAPAGGKVVLTGDFFFNGNSVFIDHGQGLISMMCHMSRIDVKEGDILNQGDLIGAVGKTGRATGPHLHWTLSLNNARVNPKLFLTEERETAVNTAEAE